MRLGSSILLAISLASPASLAATDPRVEVVERLYNDYAWEAAADGPNRATLIKEGRAVLERYLTPSLAALFLRDQACEARTHELCGIDFSPIWDSQDPEGTLYTVLPAPVENTVTVILTFPGGESHALSYVLKQVGAVWRVDDIKTSNWALRQLMRR